MLFVQAHRALWTDQEDKSLREEAYIQKAARPHFSVLLRVLQKTPLKIQTRTDCALHQMDRCIKKARGR